MNYNREELEMMFGDDPEIFHEIFSDFVESKDEMMGQVTDAINDKSADGLQISAHTLKGVLATFCSTTAKEIAFELEIMGRDGVFDDAEEKVEKLGVEVDELIKSLKDFNFNQAA